MSDYQKFIAVGRIASDITLRETANNSVCNFTLAVNESWVKDGEKQQRTEFVRVTQWGSAGKATAKYMSKGKQCMIEGKLKTETYDKDGEKRYSVGILADRVLFLGGKSDDSIPS